MNVEINEKQVLSLINRIIIDHYGQELVMDENDGYTRFTIPGIVDDDGDEIYLFHKNYWGMLWVNNIDLARSIDLVEKIKNIFGFDEDELKYYLSKYFENKYNIKIKQVAIIW